MFAFISNEKVNNSIRNMDGTVNTAVDNSLGFVEDTQRVNCTCFSSAIHFCSNQEANITIDRYDEVNAFVQCEINSKYIFDALIKFIILCV